MAVFNFSVSGAVQSTENKNPGVAGDLHLSSLLLLPLSLPLSFFIPPPSLIQPLSSHLFIWLALLLLHSFTRLVFLPLLFLSSLTSRCDFQGVSQGLSTLYTVRPVFALPH